VTETGGFAAAIPAIWARKKIKYLASLRSGDAITAESISETGEYPVYGGNGLRGFTSAFTHSGEFVLIGRQGALCGCINYASGRFWASEHAVVVDSGGRFNVRWLGELLRSLDLNQYSQSAAQPGLAVGTVSNLSVPVPPEAEQNVIGAFIERQSNGIDALIEKKERLITLLEEKRAALINRAVTKGLDPNAPMKDSGIPWLGLVPTNRTLAPIGSRYSVQLGKMLDSNRITGEHLAPYLRNVDVRWDRINTEELPEMDFPPDDQERYRLRRGDLLVCEGGEGGRCATWESPIPECFYQKALHRLRPLTQGEHPRFLYYCLRAAAGAGLFTAEGNPNTIDHLSAEKLKKHRFPFPTGAEQAEIASALDRETARIGAIIAKIREQIAKFREYRTALISAAVTGKIGVRGSAEA
jgi:type I restriction enzyme S subunit